MAMSKSMLTADREIDRDINVSPNVGSGDSTPVLSTTEMAFEDKARVSRVCGRHRTEILNLRRRTKCPVR